MTKLRAPGSIDAALARIAGHLEAGYAAMATLTGRAERTVRNYCAAGKIPGAVSAAWAWQ